ncbi:MAG: 3'-5' exonuclease, partial [Thermosynechococcaceae cyanobacterium MS004]|nr:3'-5' exonuclease [Thermosynechococcaceae cyanobacterium MS004]
MLNEAFLVIDTEGRPLLHQIAVVDHTGRLIYEAFTPSKAGNTNPDYVKPLSTILHELSALSREQLLIAHNADHDRDVLRYSYASVGLNPPDWKFVCTYQSARTLFPGMESYGLEYLAKKLEIGTERFSEYEAHSAAYDAKYTYYLYRRLQLEQNRLRLKQQPNPFSSTRVDSPFQSFTDAHNIYAAEYIRLKSILIEIQQDPNAQSKGVVVIGEAGTGKTHLMMRLAQDVLSTNRVLFVRQPTNAGSVQYHIYSRILESLIQTADDQGHTQLDLLLIRSIRQILRRIPETDQIGKDKDILTALEAESLEKLGGETTEVKRSRWDHIEKRVLEWWAQHHSTAGYRQQILHGILRFCRYTDPKRREIFRHWLSTGELTDDESKTFGLSAWDDNDNREEFSLQATQVFGELSRLDQPLILVFDQLEGLWLEGNRPILLRFGEVLKEIFTHVPNSLIILTLFPDRWNHFKNDFDSSITERVSQYILQLKRPLPEQLTDILNLRLENLDTVVSEVFTNDDLEIITKQPSIRNALNRANDFYAHRIKDVPLPSWVEAEATYPERSQDVLSQRVDRMEQKLDVLYDLVKTLIQGQISSADAPAAQAIAKLENSENLPSLSNRGYQEKLRAFLESEADALRHRFRQKQIITDDSDIGKLRQICQAFRCVKSLEAGELRLGGRILPVHILLQDQRGTRCIGFLNVSSPQSIRARLGNLNQLVIRHPQTTFMLIRDVQMGSIHTPATFAELQRFQNARPSPPYKTHFQMLDLEKRVEFELVFKLVMDIVNRDLDIPMP